MCGLTPLHKTELLPVCVAQNTLTSSEKSGLGQCRRGNTKLDTKGMIFDKFCLSKQNSPFFLQEQFINLQSRFESLNSSTLSPSQSQ